MTSVADQHTAQAVSPAAIIELAGGFRAARFLMAACELGVFEALADAPADLAALASHTGLTPRAARICADAMVAAGLLERDGDDYRNSAAAATYLAGDSPLDLRPFIKYSAEISYPGWTDLSQALRHGPTADIADLDPRRQQIFSAGVEAVNAGAAAALAATADFAGCHWLLDIGGGTGSWSIAVVRANPHMAATVVELPQVADLAREQIADRGLLTRIATVDSDILADELPAGHDCCLLANVIHVFSPEENVGLLARARRAVIPGARLLIADYWTNPAHTEPIDAALMAGEYAMNSEHGDVYSLDEGRDWLARTGWRFVSCEQLSGAKALLVAEAV